MAFYYVGGLWLSYFRVALLMILSTIKVHELMLVTIPSKNLY